MLRLRPDAGPFHDLFSQIGTNVARAGVLLVDALAAFPASDDATAGLRACEQAGDRLTAELHRLLDATLLTPFDREDAFDLATALDDVVDHLDEAADLVLLYGVRAVPEEALRQARVTARATAELAAATAALRGFGDVMPHLEEIRAAEREADELHRAALARLFGGDLDPLVVVRWKDIHGEIEEAANACRRAGLLLETIYLKNR